MKKIIAWLNKPLPEGVCWAMGKTKRCNVCWVNVIVITSVITLAVIFTPEHQLTPSTDCGPEAGEISSRS